MAKDTREYQLHYYNGADRLGVEGVFRTKTAKTYRTIFVHPEIIVAVARYLGPVLAEPDGGARGHAMWHYENPTAQYPCDQCRAAVKAKARTTRKER